MEKGIDKDTIFFQYKSENNKQITFEKKIIFIYTK